jgi:hypothetical protein
VIKNKTSANVNVYNIEIEVDNATQDLAISDIGNLGKLPLVWYNGILIHPKLINSFYLDTEGFLPRLRIYFKDANDIMDNSAFAMDNTIISIYIDSRTKDSGSSPALRPIRMDFKIVDFTFLETEKLFYIQGLPNVDGLYLQNIQSFSKKSSYNTLKDLATKIKLGFNTNISSTDDVMNWINPGIENYKFIQDVTEKSYKDESSFFTSFIDYYYNLNFVEVETELKENVKDLKGILTSMITSNEDNSQIVGDLHLVNDAFTKSVYNVVFDDFKVNNKSTKISLKNGYRTELFYYDKTGNWNEKAGTDLKFTLETNTDGKGIILKSFPKDNKNDGFFKQNIKKEYLPPLDIDNTHRHYNYASLLNKSNLEEINKVSMVITMKYPNFNLIKYQKVLVSIFENTIGQESLNTRLSGGWLITAINFIYSPEIGLKQEIKMIKRELSVNNFDV